MACGRVRGLVRVSKGRRGTEERRGVGVGKTEGPYAWGGLREDLEGPCGNAHREREHKVCHEQ